MKGEGKAKVPPLSFLYSLLPSFPPSQFQNSSPSPYSLLPRSPPSQFLNSSPSPYSLLPSSLASQFLNSSSSPYTLLPSSPPSQFLNSSPSPYTLLPSSSYTLLSSTFLCVPPSNSLTPLSLSDLVLAFPQLVGIVSFTWNTVPVSVYKAKVSPFVC